MFRAFSRQKRGKKVFAMERQTLTKPSYLQYAQNLQFTSTCCTDSRSIHQEFAPALSLLGVFSQSSHIKIPDQDLQVVVTYIIPSIHACVFFRTLVSILLLTLRLAQVLMAARFGRTASAASSPTWHEEHGARAMTFMESPYRMTFVSHPEPPRST